MHCVREKCTRRLTHLQTVTCGTLFWGHLSHGVAGITAQSWSMKRALASKGEVYVQIDTHARRETDRQHSDKMGPTKSVIWPCGNE